MLSYNTVTVLLKIRGASVCHILSPADILFLKHLYLFVSLATYSTESRGDLVRRSLHDADQRWDETHLHGALATFNLCQLFKDVLSKRRHHRV